MFSAQFDATIDPYPPEGLVNDQSVQIDVSYAPTGDTNDQGTLFIKSNGGKTLQIALTGQGTN